MATERGLRIVADLYERKSGIPEPLAVAVIHQGIRLIQTTNQADSTLWLERLAVRAAKFPQQDRRRYAQRPRPTQANAAEAMLAAVPGIGPERAAALERILDRSLEDGDLRPPSLDITTPRYQDILIERREDVQCRRL